MTNIEQRLLEILQNQIDPNDPSHDIEHTKRVLAMAKHVATEEGADLEIIIPAAIFHDAVTYAKNDPRNKTATDESAAFARTILERPEFDYPAEKISSVEACILECSWSKGIPPSIKESAVLQDADRMEATGAISLMRTFSSGGKMERPLYDATDPFCEHREPNGLVSSFDLYYQRLIKVAGVMHTEAGRKVAQRRHEFLKSFESELKEELRETGMYHS